MPIFLCYARICARNLIVIEKNIKNLSRVIALGCCLGSSLFAAGELGTTPNSAVESLSALRAGIRIDVMPDLVDIISGPDGLQRIQTYLNEEANPNLVDHGDQQSLLEIFCSIGDKEMVNLLLGKGAFIPYLDKKSHHALYCIASLDKDRYTENHTSLAETLIRKVTQDPSFGKDIATAMINQADAQGITSLHIASVKGHPDIVRLLIRSGANLDQVDHHGRTALHFACYMGHDTIINDLLDYGASPTVTNREGLSAKDFFNLGGIEEDLRRNPTIADRLEKGHVQHYRNHLHGDDTLNEFFTTFERKCTSVFLAYKVLESGTIQGTKDVLSVSNAINLLGNSIPLPGGGIVTSVAAAAAGAVENHIESKKKKMITEFFTTVKDMEEAVRESAYKLTQEYEHAIRELTVDGARVLANYGVARFLAYMRHPDTTFIKTKSLTEYVLESIQTTKTHSYLAKFSFWNHKIRIGTKDGKSFTDGEIFKRNLEIQPLSLTPQDIDEEMNAHVVDQAGCCFFSAWGGNKNKNKNKK